MENIFIYVKTYWYIKINLLINKIDKEKDISTIYYMSLIPSDINKFTLHRTCQKVDTNSLNSIFFCLNKHTKKNLFKQINIVIF